MNFTESIQLLDSRKAELDQLSPFESADEARLWQKLRLEWNLHSNHIEGNTLTYKVFDQNEMGSFIDRTGRLIVKDIEK